jgi:hypothetical protein
MDNLLFGPESAPTIARRRGLPAVVVLDGPLYDSVDNNARGSLPLDFVK